MNYSTIVNDWLFCEINFWLWLSKDYYNNNHFIFTTRLTSWQLIYMRWMMRDKPDRQRRLARGIHRSIEATRLIRGIHRSIEATRLIRGIHRSIEATRLIRGIHRSIEATRLIRGIHRSIEATRHIRGIHRSIEATRLIRGIHRSIEATRLDRGIHPIEAGRDDGMNSALNVAMVIN